MELQEKAFSADGIRETARDMLSSKLLRTSTGGYLTGDRLRGFNQMKARNIMGFSSAARMVGNPDLESVQFVCFRGNNLKTVVQAVEDHIRARDPRPIIVIGDFAGSRYEVEKARRHCLKMGAFYFQKPPDVDLQEFERQKAEVYRSATSPVQRENIDVIGEHSSLRAENPRPIDQGAWREIAERTADFEYTWPD